MREICTKKYFVKSYIEIKPSPIHRYGVFAIKDIFPDEIIEECPVVTFQKSILEHQSEINRRAFFWDDANVAIALGCGSIYNHSDNPNADYSVDHDNETIKFIAIKPIVADTEILIDYAYDDEEEVFSQEKSENNRGLHKVFILLLFLFVLSIIFPIHL